MIQKQGHWVPNEFKSRDVERRYLTCEMLLQQQRRKDFLHRIVTGDEKWIQYNKPKGKRSRGKTATHRHLAQSQISMIWSFSSAFEGDQLGAIYYEFLKPNETITEYLYRLHLMRLSRPLKKKTTTLRAEIPQGDFVTRQLSATWCDTGENLLENI